MKTYFSKALDPVWMFPVSEWMQNTLFRNAGVWQREDVLVSDVKVGV